MRILELILKFNYQIIFNHSEKSLEHWNIPITNFIYSPKNQKGETHTQSEDGRRRIRREKSSGQEESGVSRMADRINNNAEEAPFNRGCGPIFHSGAERAALQVPGGGQTGPQRAPPQHGPQLRSPSSAPSGQA